MLYTLRSKHRLYLWPFVKLCVFWNIVKWYLTREEIFLYRVTTYDTINDDFDWDFFVW